MISFIVPTFEEAAVLPDTLRRLAALPVEHEIIVVDGGSQDGTREIAAEYGLCVGAPRARGTQLRAGAEAARGDPLVFVHADCWIDAEAIDSALEVLAAGAVAGCFRQRIEASGNLYRWIEQAAFWRATWLRSLYGDSGLFLPRVTYERAGGHPAVPLFEDVLLSRRLRSLGRLAVAPRGHIHVSPRRWQERGPVRTTLLNWSLEMGFLAGISPQRLARWYYSPR